MGQGDAPDRPSALTTAGHAIASIVLLGGLVIVFQRRRLDDAIAVLTMMGALLTVMILISPEAHTHYFCLPIPLVMALAQAHWRGSRRGFSHRRERWLS